MKKKRKKRNPRKTLKNKCDKLWAKLTKEFHIAKHGRVCLWCKKPSDELHSDHIINRWKAATRWNLSNCVVLDKVCHIFRKKREPLAWAKMVQENVAAETLEAITLISREIYKPDYQDVLDYLTGIEKDRPWEILEGD